MRSRWLVALVVALTVVVAGCSGTGGEADGPYPDGGDTTTAAGDQDTGGDEDGSDGGATTTEAGSGAEGEVIGLGDPESLLREAGSFTASWSYEFTEAGAETSRFEYDVAVDLATNRSMEFSRTAGDGAGGEAVVYERYNDGLRSYMKYGSGEEAFFMSMPQEGSPFAEAAGDVFAGDMADYTRVGSETFDGVTVTRYEYRDPLLWQQYGAGTVEDDLTVTDFALVVLVDGDGLARSTSWHLTGETDAGEVVTGNWEYTVTKLGSTDVQEPAWLETAKTQTGTG
jgi:hypothetical protein